MSDGRIELIDAWRGLALWLMLVYHLLFDLVMFGWMRWQTLLSWPLTLLEQFIAWSFILCCGISCRFSRKVWKRGVICALAGLVVVAASYVVDAPIKFGVLQFLSAAMLLYAALGKWTDKLRHPVFPVLYMALFFVAKFWTESRFWDVSFLWWLGFRQEGFVSYDYFPILPNIFLFLLGTWLGGWVKEHRNKPIFSRSAPKLLTAPGKQTLFIYILHQPLLYGVCWLFSILL